MEEYRVDVKVRNNIILKKIEEAGYKTLGEFCRLNGIMKYVSQLGSIINMKESPLQTDGQFRKCIIHAGSLLGCDPLDFFTDTQLHTILKTNKRIIKVNEAEMRFMLENHTEQKLLEDMVEDEQKECAIQDLLNTLTPKEKQVIEMRMGLGEYDREHTLKEISEKMGYAFSERARQIEAKALRKMRHPSRAKMVRGFLSEKKREEGEEHDG